MNQKQYDDMTSIMQFGRIFSKAMRRAMENCGLLQKGYFLTVSSEEIECDDGTVITGSVRLAKLFDGNNTDHSEDMEQLEYNGERWVVIYDPYAKTGSVPPEVRIERKADDSKRVAKASGKPYPPDGLWLSSRDDNPDVVGGQ